MKPQYSINPKTGNPYDFGPYFVKIESSFLNTEVEFYDLPSEARFPYAVDRASRYAARMDRQFPGAEIFLTGSDGITHDWKTGESV